MWILSIGLVFKFRLIKRFWVDRIWQTRSFLRRVLGDTDGGLETGKTELICYVCSFRGLEISVNHNSGENPARRVRGKTNLVSAVRGLARTSHVMDALRCAPYDLAWASRISRFLHYMCVCLFVHFLFFSLRETKHISLWTFFIANSQIWICIQKSPWRQECLQRCHFGTLERSLWVWCSPGRRRFTSQDDPK